MSEPQVTAVWSSHLCGLAHQQGRWVSWRNLCRLPGLSSLASSSSSLAPGFLEILALPWASSPCPGLFSWCPLIGTASPSRLAAEAARLDAPGQRCSPGSSCDALAVVLASSSRFGVRGPQSWLSSAALWFPVPRASLSCAESALWLRASAPVAQRAGCSSSSATGRL